MTGRAKSARRGAKKAPARRKAGKPQAARKAAATAAEPSGPRLVTRAEAARELSVAPAKLNKWVADGAPVGIPGRRGHSAWYDVEALREWRDRHKATTGEQQLALAQERAKLARVTTKLKELQLAVETGDMVPRDQVLAEGQAVLSALKTRLLAIPRHAILRGLIPADAEPGLRALVVDALREMARWEAVPLETPNLSETGA